LKISNKAEEKPTALAGMLRRLQLYDKQCEAPALKPFKTVVPYFSKEQLASPSATVAVLEKNFQPLLKHAQ
jgi:hypothetical protein